MNLDQICSQLDNLLSTYHRRVPEGMESNWTQAPGLISIPPIKSFVDCDPQSFQEGMSRADGLEANACKRFGPVGLQSQEEHARGFSAIMSFLQTEPQLYDESMVYMLGIAVGYLESGEQEKAAVLMHGFQQRYFLWNHHVLRNEGIERAVPLGHPFLHIESREIKQGNSELLTISNDLLEAQTRIMGRYNSPENTSVLGLCQVHDFFVDKKIIVPYNAVSVVWQGDKLDGTPKSHLLMLNPRVTQAEVFENMFATNGWYGFWEGRIFDKRFRVLIIQYDDITGTRSEITFKSEDGDRYEISYGQINGKKTERQGAARDPVITYLVAGQLVQGCTPFDFMMEMPRPFDGEALTSLESINRQGYYPNLKSYYNAAGRQGNEEKARGLLYQHHLPNSKEVLVPNSKADGPRMVRLE